MLPGRVSRTLLSHSCTHSSFLIALIVEIFLVGSVFFFICVCVFCAAPHGMRDLGFPDQGLSQRPLYLEVWSLNDWTTRKSLWSFSLWLF